MILPVPKLVTLDLKGSIIQGAFENKEHDIEIDTYLTSIIEPEAYLTKFISHSPLNCLNFLFTRSMAFPVAARIFPQALKKKLKKTAHVKNNDMCIPLSFIKYRVRGSPLKKTSFCSKNED